MKKFIVLVFAIMSFAEDNEQQIVNCNIIFEQRKAEILKEIEKIDEQQQALQALQSATQNVLNQREEDLKKREAGIASERKALEEKEALIARMIKKNEELLKQVRAETESKVNETYAGMKDSKSAAILENLPEKEAATILFGLDTKTMSKILAKMNPQKAATLTQLIQKGPPFSEEEQKNTL
ncbi:MotE family protein [Helicobacter mesocricetorum]|uniref:MotE family protein n=1 Tax=Helicobacter mesocricetorum TaxID=87012 RepID=UPI000CF06941|nr:MotE family protein [Helicobacter mesocricetorum]